MNLRSRAWFREAPLFACVLSQETTAMATHRAHWATHHRILAGILVAAILVGGGLLIAQDQETLRIKAPLAVEDPRFPDYLSRLLGHPITEGDSYVVHTNGDDAFPAMLDAIE